jgi:hypothetical protein
VQRNCQYFLEHNWPWLYYLGKKLTVTWQATIGYWMTNTEIHPTSKANPQKISTLCFDPLGAYHYSTRDTIYAVLFREMVSINYLSLINIWVVSEMVSINYLSLINIWVVSEKIVILCFQANIKDPSFWSQNVHIHRVPTYDNQTLKYWIWTKYIQQFRC